MFSALLHPDRSAFQNQTRLFKGCILFAPFAVSRLPRAGLRTFRSHDAVSECRPVSFNLVLLRSTALPETLNSIHEQLLTWLAGLFGPRLP
jgi:hypothetical protein